MLKLKTVKRVLVDWFFFYEKVFSLLIYCNKWFNEVDGALLGAHNVFGGCVFDVVWYSIKNVDIGGRDCDSIDR